MFVEDWSQIRIFEYQYGESHIMARQRPSKECRQGCQPSTTSNSTDFSVKKIQLFVDIDLIILFRRSKYHRQQSNYFQKKNIFH